MISASGMTGATDDPTSEVQALLPQREVAYDGQHYDIIREGLAEILIPQCASKDSKGSGGGKSKSSHRDDTARPTVFYNPVQQYNRDLSVLAVKAFAEDLAAVRLDKQKRREQHASTGTEQRGKKRKRKAGVEAQKKYDAGSKEAQIMEESFVEVEAGKDGLVHPDADGAPKNIKEPQESGENGAKSREIAKNNDAKVQAGEAAEQEAEEKTLSAPKGPKNKANIFTQPFRILDALSASGLRALRYAKEIPMTTSVTANDLSSPAVESIKINVAHNTLASRVTVNTGDAIDHMHLTMTRANGRIPQAYHVIDLDPYGTSAPYLDAAVQAITDGGLLCVTCTDAGVFASKGYSEKTYSQYGGLPLKGPHAHEAGLRLILHAIATSAGRYGIAIEPLLSLSIDFYARVFVRVHKRPADVKFLASKTMAVYQCDGGCGSWTTQFFAHAKRNENRNGETFYKFTSALGPSAGKECEHCGFKTHLAGPMWGGALHNSFFVQRILDMLPDLDREVYQTVPRIEGMLSLALEEELDDPWTSTAYTKDQSPTHHPPKEGSISASEVTATNGVTSGHDQSTKGPLERPVPPLPAHYRTRYPFFIHPPSLARALITTTPSDASLRGALRHLGYLTSRSHTKAGSIITNAPFTVIWEIMREWARQDREKRTDSQTSTLPSNINPNTVGAGIFKNDRSQSTFQSAKTELRQRIDQANSAQDLRSELQAALYRLDNPDKPHPTITNTASANTAEANGLPHARDDPPSNVDPTSPNHTPSMANHSLFAQPPGIALSDLHTLDIRFDERLGKDPRPVGPGRNRKMIRYQENPREHWGPLGKAKR